MESVFISATSKDLSRARRHIADVVLQLGHLPVVEHGFQAQSHEVPLRKFLTWKLRECSVVIHVAGRCCGEMAMSRQSWTQMEYQEAKRLGKKLLVAVAHDSMFIGKTYGESAAQIALQAQHRERLQKGRGIFYMFKHVAELTAPVAGFLRQIEGDGEQAKTKVLFVGAERGTSLDLRGELARLRKAVRSRDGSDRLEIAAIFDATPAQIVEAINREQPSIVHLSGKQDSGTIKLHNDRGQLTPFGADYLARALAGTKSRSLKLVVLDTCGSMQQARLLTKKYGVPHSIGIYDAIVDDVATEFYAAFYSQLAAADNLACAVRTAREIVAGTLDADEKTRQELERDVLEMPFNASIHIPMLISAPDADPLRTFF